MSLLNLYSKLHGFTVALTIVSGYCCGCSYFSHSIISIVVHSHSHSHSHIVSYSIIVCFSNSDSRLYTCSSCLCSQCSRFLSLGPLLHSHKDISTLECGHSAIREFTKMRGKGHVPSLTEISAKSVCKFASKYHNHHEAPAANPEPGNEDSIEQDERPKQDRGGGGAWRAFLSETCKGTKLTRAALRGSLKQTYRNLSAEEFQHYKEVGRAMTLESKFARRLGLKPSRREAIDDAGNSSVAIFENSSSILVDANPSLLMDGDNFSDRLVVFKKFINKERREKRAAEKASRQPNDPTDAGSQDASMAELSRFAGPGLLHGLRRGPINDGDASLAVDRFEWKLPLIPFVRAVLHSKSVHDEDVNGADLVNQWSKLHELVQHENLEKIDFEGKKAPFKKTLCAKLGVCVCSTTGKAFAAMARLLAAYMKRSFPGTMQLPSEEKKRFCEKLCVLELSSKELSLDSKPPLEFGVDGSDGHRVLFLHCGHTNFSTWETTCTRLHPCYYNPFTGS